MAAGAPEHGQVSIAACRTPVRRAPEHGHVSTAACRTPVRLRPLLFHAARAADPGLAAGTAAEARVAALEIRELKAQLSELQTHEAATRPSSRLYSSVSGIARPAADVSEIARLQELLERETIARARAEADALDLEMRMGDMQRASSHRRPPAEGDSHETADDGDGGVTDLRDQVAHLQKRLAQAEARSDASARESVLEREVRRKNMQLEQQVRPHLVCRVAGWQGRVQRHASGREVQSVAIVGRKSDERPQRGRFEVL